MPPAPVSSLILCFCVLGAGLGFFGCSLNPFGSNAELKIRVNGASPPSVPLSTASIGVIDDFDCVLVNVMGRDIPDANHPERVPDYAALYDGDHCASYEGFTSTFVPFSDGGTVSLSVPTGKDRLVQVFGVESTIGCPNQTIGEIEQQYGENSSTSTGGGDVFDDLFPTFAEIGRKTVNVLGATAVTIQSSFDANNIKNLVDCNDGSPSLTLVAGKSGSNGATYPTNDMPNVPVDWVTSPSFGAQLSASELDTIRQGGSGTLYVGGPSTSYRVDLLFSLDGYNLSQYSGVKVEVVGQGGANSGGCSAVNYPITSPGLEFRAYFSNSGTGSGWSSMGGYGATIGAGNNNLLEHLYNISSGGTPEQFSTSMINVGGSATAKPYLAVSIRPSALPANACIHLDEVRAYLVQ